MIDGCKRMVMVSWFLILIWMKDENFWAKATVL